MTSSPPSGSDSARREPPADPGFEALARPVQRWIWQNGWTELRGVQQRAIPLLLDGDGDVVIAAPTASGKTEAAFIPLLSRLALSNRRGPGFDFVYVSPLKALINDQFRRLDDLCESLEVPVHKWHGDVSESAKARALRAPGGILLTTPESLEAMFVLRGSEVPRLFQGLSGIVVDELHSMVDTERGVQLRSLLNRLEQAIRHRVRRVGLSATLGDMRMAQASLRHDAPDEVAVVRSSGGGQQVKLLLKGYAGEGFPAAEDASSEQASERRIARHIFESLRGSRNLVFANSRAHVELYADRLGALCDEARLPNEFFAHHGSLARQHREHLEDRLRSASEPTTAVCTSTLELGIDIGAVDSIAQIGPPFSVSSTRQRLGRSGRRKGKAAVMRLYVPESELAASSHLTDVLRIRLVRAVAILELVLEGWCEPPAAGALHLSTLVQQILSIIAERGGAAPASLFDTLCRRGPFAAVSAELFLEVLRSIGGGDDALIEQAPDGALLLARMGESLVERHTFYAAFATPDEYRVVADGRTLGSVPATFAVVVGSTIIFGGKRWRIANVDEGSKVIEVAPGPAGEPPKFSGTSGRLHDRVAERMAEVYSGSAVPAYLDAGGRALLAEGRANYRRLGLDGGRILQIAPNRTLILPWRGSAVTETLALALMQRGLEASARDHVVVEVEAGERAVRTALRRFAEGAVPDPVVLAGLMGNLEEEKYHRYLSRELRCLDAASGRIAADRLPEVAAGLLGARRSG